MKQVVASFILVAVIFAAQGQAIEISTTGGYTLNGSVDYYNGEIDVKNGPVWGLTLGYDMGNDTQVQMVYSGNYVDTEAVEYDVIVGGYERFNTMISHYHLGVEKSLLIGNDQVQPYGGLSLGMSSYVPRESNYDTRVKFSMGLGAGVKVFPTDRVGLKFQAKMYMPMIFNGVGIYCGTGSGCGGGSSFYIPILHGEFTGGLVFRIEK